MVVHPATHGCELSVSLWFGAVTSGISLVAIVLLIPIDLKADAYLMKHNAAVQKRLRQQDGADTDENASSSGDDESDGDGASGSGEEISLSDVKKFGIM